MPETVPALDQGADGLLEGSHLPESEPAVSPERGLWLAVIATAWFDAFQASEAWLRNTDRTADPQVIRGESRRWLTMGGDCGYARDREEVCHLAGVDPDVIRHAARKRLAEIKAGAGAGTTAEVVNLDRAFAALLDNEATMVPDEIDKALEELAALEIAA